MKKYIVLAVLLTIIIPSFVFALSIAPPTPTDVDPDGGTSSCVSIQNNLRYRTRDASVNGEVSTLQDFLQSKNYLAGEPTGYFGLLTLKAVKDFQKANDISPTGYVGPTTRTKIAFITCDGIIPTPKIPTSPALIDAQIKTYMANARAQAELYYDSHNNSYAGVCTNEGGIRTLLFSALWQLSLSEQSYVGGNNSSFVYSATGAGLSSVCHDSSSAWAAITSLKQPTMINAGWCVDSTGVSREGTSLTANTVACPQQIITPLIKIGDVNGDGLINCTDTKMISDYSVGLINLTSTSLQAADVNADGVVNIIDAQQLARNHNLSCGTNPATPVISYLQGAGCTSVMGSTAVSGDLCSAAVLGGTVYVFGKNFTSNAKIFFGDGRLSVIPLFISSTSLSFKVPLSLGGAPSIYVGMERDGKSYISNSMSLPLQSSTSTLTPSVTFTINSGTFIASGSTKTILLPLNQPLGIAWNGTNVSSCEFIQPSTLNGTRAASGSFTLQSYESGYPGVNSDGIYRMDCNGNNGSKVSVSVTVLRSSVAFINGDANIDGVVNCLDVKLISDYSVGLVTLTEDKKSRADVTGDGVVNMIDAQQITTNHNLSCGTTPATPTLSITTSSVLLNAKVGTYYNKNIEVAGNNDNYYTWLVSSGSLPPGLVLSPSLCPTSPCSAAGIISGSPNVAGTYTFTLKLTTGFAPNYTYTTKQFTLTVEPATISGTPPIVSITADRSNIQPGQSVKIAWLSTNAISAGCWRPSWTQGWSGSIDNSGSLDVTLNTAGTYNFQISCANSSGSTSANVTVTVNSSTSAPSIIYLEAPASIAPNRSFIINWNTNLSINNPAVCTITDSTGKTYSDSSGSVFYVGSLSITPTKTETYTLKCINSLGQDSKNVTVIIDPELALTADDVKVTLAVNPSTISSQESATLTWTSTNTTSCDIGSTNGSKIVKPTQTTLYQVTCYNPKILASYGKVAYATLTVSTSPFASASGQSTVAGAATCLITNTLRVGAEGAEVSCLQTRLGINVDGKFGPKTKASVIAFQAKAGLVADGIIGPLSITALLK